MAYAVFTGDPHYHLVTVAGGYRTMCNLSTKGSVKNVREPRLPARVMAEQPPPSLLYKLCPLCAVARAQISR